MDIESMLAKTAAAAEDTGEKNVGEPEIHKPTPIRQKDPVETQRKPISTPVQKPVSTPVQNVQKPVFETRQKPVTAQPVSTPVQNSTFTQEQRNTRALAPAATANGGAITEASIHKILLMSLKFEKFDEKQKNFVSGYFRLEEGDLTSSKVIYKALVASQRDLDALKKIVEAKSYDPAERAFFLMDLENSEIEDIFEQLDIITGELDSTTTVNQTNKLQICRKIEKLISKLTKDVFSYIEKLQEFTNIAIG